MFLMLRGIFSYSPTTHITDFPYKESSVLIQKFYPGLELKAYVHPKQKNQSPQIQVCQFPS